MASTLPFDNADIAGTAIGTDEFVSGSGTLTETGNDKQTTTADGRIHYDREKLNTTAAFEAYGDLTDLTTAAGLGVTCILKDDSVTVKTGTGIVTATYNDSSKTTSVNVAYDPTT